MLSQKNTDSIASIVAASLQEQLTHLFTSLAEASGWPDEIVQSFNVVVHNDNAIELTYDPKYKAQVDILEYGDLDTIPNAVIRPFLARAERFIETTLEEVAVGPLLSDGLEGVL